jgi:HlyD family secretion protein
MNFETSIARRESDTVYLEDEAAAKRKRRLILIAVVVAALALAVFAMTRFAGKSADGVAAGSTAAAGKDDKTQVPHVTVIVPGRTLVANTVTATGTLAARQDMPVGAVGEGGMVSRVWVQPGTWVRAGQVLASVERSVQIQQTSQLAAQIAATQADARLAQNELDRARALLGRGFISKAEIDRKAAQRDAAAARVRVAQAQLGEARARIGRLDIRAPAAGLVLTRAVEPGQVVGPGAGVLFRIAKGGELEMHAMMSEADLARMSVGLAAGVTPVGTTNTFAGHIWQIASVIDMQMRQGMVKIALPFNRALRPGGFATAAITAGQIEAPLLPESAVQSDQKGNFVYIAGTNNKVERRDVKVGTLGDHGVSIVEGLAGTEKVIKSAGGFLNPGETIVPTFEKAAK